MSYNVNNYVYNTASFPGSDIKIPEIKSISRNNGVIGGGNSLDLIVLGTSGNTLYIGDNECTINTETISGDYVIIESVTSSGSVGYDDIILSASDGNSDTWENGWLYTNVLVPDIPSTIAVSVLGENSLMPYWSYVPDSLSFDVYRSLEEDNNFSLITNVTTNSYVDIGLSADTIYYYKVKGKNDSGDSDFSSVASNKTLNETQVGRVFYYPKTIRSIIVGLLDMFNDIKVQRYDKQGNLVRQIDVPILFAPQEKYWQLRTRSGADYPQAYWTAPVPRIGLTLNGISYNGNRAAGVNETNEFYNANLDLQDIDEFINNVSPAPYDFNFTLYIRTDEITDYSQIMEQILPYFNPSLNLRMKEFSFLNVERDLKVTLDSVTPEFLERQTKEDVRHVNGQITLTVEGFMYRPVTSEKIIHQITTNYALIDSLSNSISASTYNINISGDISGVPYL